MKQAKVSVIVPVYNVARYLHTCVASIQRQTLEELEIILVDDGSTDGSGGICDELAACDRRIRVLHKPNGGLSDARNAGFAEAGGEYVTFVDSDDWVSADLAATLLEEARRARADVVVCDLLAVAREDSPFPPRRGGAAAFTGPEAMERMLYQRPFETSACGKLYQRSLLEGFCFPRGRLYEDLFTLYKVLYKADKVVYIPQKLYAYRENPESIMHQTFSPRMFDQLDAADEIVAFVEANCPEYLPAANARRFSSYSQVLRWMKGADRSDEAVRQAEERIWRFLKGYRRQMLLDKNARAKNRAAAALALLGKKIYSAL